MKSEEKEVFLFHFTTRFNCHAKLLFVMGKMKINEKESRAIDQLPADNKLHSSTGLWRAINWHNGWLSLHKWKWKFIAWYRSSVTNAVHTDWQARKFCVWKFSPCDKQQQQRWWKASDQYVSYVVVWKETHYGETATTLISLTYLISNWDFRDFFKMTQKVADWIILRHQKILKLLRFLVNFCVENSVSFMMQLTTCDWALTPVMPKTY